MASQRFDSPDFHDHTGSDFATETGLIAGATSLPKLSAAFRDRVLTAATAAFHEARRWTQAKQAASLLSLALLASLLLTPFAAMHAVLSAHNAQLDAGELPGSTHLSAVAFSLHSEFAAWSWRTHRDLPARPSDSAMASVAARRSVELSNRTSPNRLAASEPSRPALVAKVTAHDGWDSVQTVITDRSKLSRAFGIREAADPAQALAL